MARPSRSRSKVDVSDLIDFENRLATAARIVEREAEDFQTEWGNEWVREMKSRVPVSTTDRSPGSRRYGHLRDNIQQIEPGGITFGDAFWWVFLERGTTRMSAQPFIKPAMKKIRTPARKDAGERAIDLIQRGRI